MSTNLLSRQFLAEDSSTPQVPLGHLRFRRAALLEVVPGLAAGALVMILRAPAADVATGGLLSATAILTGFTFALSMQMWKASLDARRDTRYAFDAEALILMDRLQSTLLYAAGVGVATTTWLGGMLVWGGEHPWRWAVAVGTALFAYSVVMVIGSLLVLYRAGLRLR